MALQILAELFFKKLLLLLRVWPQWLAAFIFLLMVGSASAQQDVWWDGTSTANKWTQYWNWTNQSGGGPPPTHPDGVNDTARFTGDGNGNTEPYWDGGSNHLELKWLRFETSSCAAYTISRQDSGDSNNLLISDGGGVYVDGNVTENQTINMRLRPKIGTTTYTNNGGGLLSFPTGMQTYWATGNAEVIFDGSGNIQAYRLLNGAADRTMSVVKQGTGTLTLTGNNTYTGDTTASAGTVRLGVDNALPTGTTLSMGESGNAAFDLNGFDQTLGDLTYTAPGTTYDRTLTFTGTDSALTVNAEQDTELGSGGQQVWSTRYMTADMSGLSEFVWNGADHVFRVGFRADASQASGVYADGYQKTFLADTNTITADMLAVGDKSLNRDGGNSFLYLGTTNTINADTINIGASGRSNATLEFRDDVSDPSVTIRSSDGAGAVNNWDVGRVANFNTTIWEAVVDFSGAELDALVGTLRIGIADPSGQSNRKGTQDSTFTMGKGTLQVTDLIVGELSGNSGSSDATYAANGTFNLNNADGTVTANQVILANNVGTVTGGTRNVTGTFNLDAGTLEAGTIDRGAQTGTATNVTANFNFSGGTVRNLVGQDMAISDVPVNLTGTGTRFFEATGGQSITVAADAVIGGAGGFTKTGAGTLILSGDHNYTGATTVSDGILRISSDNALGTTGGTTTVTSGSGAAPRVELAGSITTGETFSLGTRGLDPHISNISGNNVITGLIQGSTGGSFVVIESQGGHLELAGGFEQTSSTGSKIFALTGNGNGTVSGTIANGTSDGIQLRKYGNGTWDLSGNNAYTGVTEIRAGTLLVNGTTASSGFTVYNGGTLGGEGSLSPVTLDPGGTVSPGNSIGTLGGTDLTWDTDDLTAGMIFELSNTDNQSDLLNLSGAFTKGTGDQFVIDLIGGRTGTVYTLINFTSTTFALEDFVVNTSLPVGRLEFAGGSLLYIPEPASLALLGLGLLSLCHRHRTP